MSTQVHGKFKLFMGELAADKTLGALADAVASFAKDKAAKSIGVEYLESLKKLVITLGYRDDEPAYAVSLKAANLGKLTLEDAAQIEGKMAVASQAAGAVLCHELYITDENDFIMVFLVKN